MTYEQLQWLQITADTLFNLCLLGGLIYLIIGLIRPSWVGMTKRRWIPLRALAIWLVGFLILAPITFYTHSHPMGLHSFNSYMASFAAKQCMAGAKADIPVAQDKCEELFKKCKKGEIESTHPSCKIMKNWKPAANGN